MSTTKLRCEPFAGYGNPSIQFNQGPVPVARKRFIHGSVLCLATMFEQLEDHSYVLAVDQPKDAGAGVVCVLSIVNGEFVPYSDVQFLKLDLVTQRLARAGMALFDPKVAWKRFE